MPNLDEIYPSKSNHLKADDLQGRSVNVAIESVDTATFDDGTKIVLKFQGKEKTMVLNKTNAKKIGEYYGGNTDDWIGKPVIVFPDKTDFNGKMVDCLRVRVELAEDPDEKIPF